MVITVQILVSFGIGVVAYLCASAFSFYDGGPWVVFQTLIGACVTLLVLPLVAAAGLHCRLVPIGRDYARNAILVAGSLLAGVALIGLSASDALAARIEVDGFEARQLEPCCAVCGWLLSMLSPFPLTTGRERSLDCQYG